MIRGNRNDKKTSNNMQKLQRKQPRFFGCPEQSRQKEKNCVEVLTRKTNEHAAAAKKNHISKDQQERKNPISLRPLFTSGSSKGHRK